jgi:hypothetical protein
MNNPLTINYNCGKTIKQNTDFYSIKIKLNEELLFLPLSNNP